MSEENLKRLREQRQRLLKLTASPTSAKVARAEQQRRDTLRLIGGPAALTSLFCQRRPFAEMFIQTKPMLSFYESTGISRLISHLQLFRNLTSPVFDTTSWFNTTVSPLSLGDLQKQVAELSRSIVTDQLRLFTNGLGGLDYAHRFTEQLWEPKRQWREFFEGYEEDKRRLLDVIVPRGWLISPSMEIRMVRLLARELDTYTVEEVDETLERYFEADQCSKIVQGLYSDPVFEEFRSLLDEGFAVHREGHYRAAILVWLAAIDGIAAQKFGVVSVFSEAKRKNGGHLRRAIVQTSQGRDKIHDSLIEIVKRVSIEDPDEHVPKRDVVMHGREVDFGSERASIQLLLVLEVMRYCAPGVVEDAESARPEQPALT